MIPKAYDYRVIISGVICSCVMIKAFFFNHTRLARTDRLRVYMPEEASLRGKYSVPPVVEEK